MAAGAPAPSPPPFAFRKESLVALPGGGAVDVILPVLDEAEALPVGARADARGLPRRSWSTTAPATARRSWPRALGARVVREPRRGLRRRVLRRAGGGHARRWWPSWTATARWTRRELPAVTGPVAGRPARTWCWAPAAAEPRRLAAARPRGQPRAGAGAAPARRRARSRDLGPMRAAAARARCSSSASATAASAGRWRWCCGPPPRAGGSRRSPVAYRARDGAVQGHGHGARHGPRGARHGGGAAMSARHPAGDRQGAGAGPGQDAPVPALHARAGGGAGRGGAARHAGRGGGRPGRPARRGARRRARPVAPPGFDVVPQRGGGLGERLEAAFADAGGPALPGGHGHAAGHARRCSTGRWTRSSGRASTPCSAPPPTAATGASAFAAPGAGRVRGRADVEPPARCAAQRRAAARAGPGAAELPPLRDVDTIDDARRGGRGGAADAVRRRRCAASGHAADGQQAVPEAAA